MIVARCNVYTSTQKESSFQINSPTSSRAIGRHLTDPLNSVSLFLVHLPPRTRDGSQFSNVFFAHLSCLRSNQVGLALLYNGLHISRTLRFFGSPDITHKRSRFPFLSGTLPLYPCMHNFSSHWIYQFNFCILWRSEKSVYFCIFELFSSLLTGDKIPNSLLPFQPF